jgi:hypothetical protein
MDHKTSSDWMVQVFSLVQGAGAAPKRCMDQAWNGQFVIALMMDKMGCRLNDLRPGSFGFGSDSSGAL